jgi:hypothetical protein
MLCSQTLGSFNDKSDSFRVQYAVEGFDRWWETAGREMSKGTLLCDCYVSESWLPVGPVSVCCLRVLGEDVGVSDSSSFCFYEKCVVGVADRLCVLLCCCSCVVRCLLG